MSEDDVPVIDESNFNQYFFDVRHHQPEKGQIIACFSAMADFIDSNEKKQIIDLLKMPDKAKAAKAIMRNLLYASEHDSVRVPREMIEDLLQFGDKFVLEKQYRYKVEMFYYTKPEYLPPDPHWTSISLLNL